MPILHWARWEFDRNKTLSFPHFFYGRSGQLFFLRNTFLCLGFGSFLHDGKSKGKRSVWENRSHAQKMGWITQVPISLPLKSMAKLPPSSLGARSGPAWINSSVHSFLLVPLQWQMPSCYFKLISHHSSASPSSQHRGLLKWINLPTPQWCFADTMDVWLSGILWWYYYDNMKNNVPLRMPMMWIAVTFNIISGTLLE